VELQNIVYCPQQVHMFVHDETNLDFLDRLSQRSPISDFTTILLVAAEVTHRTDGRIRESQWALWAIYSRKPKREAVSHEHPVQRSTSVAQH